VLRPELKPGEYPVEIGKLVGMLEKIEAGSTDFGVPLEDQRMELQVLDTAFDELRVVDVKRLEKVYWLQVRLGVRS
jgi:hypothetical protein